MTSTDPGRAGSAESSASYAIKADPNTVIALAIHHAINGDTSMLQRLEAEAVASQRPNLTKPPPSGTVPDDLRAAIATIIWDHCFAFGFGSSFGETKQTAAKYPGSRIDECIKPSEEAARDILVAMSSPADTAGPARGEGELRRSARALLDASLSDFGCDLEDEDDEAVGAGLDSKMAVTFGHMRRLQSALATPSTSPAGSSVVVPRALTDEMLEAGAHAAVTASGVSVNARLLRRAGENSPTISLGEEEWLPAVWEAMLAAAPPVAPVPPQTRDAAIEAQAILEVAIEDLKGTAAKVRAGASGDKVAAWIEMSIRDLLALATIRSDSAGTASPPTEPKLGSFPRLVLVKAGGKFFIHSDEGDEVPDFTFSVPEDLEDVAEAIVERCNLYDDLVDALKSAVAKNECGSADDDWVKAARAAIAMTAPLSKGAA